MYSYHNRIKKRIKNGELIGVEKSDRAEFAFVLLFSTPPHTRPIRHHAVWRYDDILAQYGWAELLEKHPEDYL